MLVLQAVRIHITILTRGLTGHLMMPSLQNLPGKIWDDNTRKRVKCSLESFPRDRPRGSLLINDNYSVNFLFPSRLTGNKEQIPRKTRNTQLNVRSLVAKDVVSAPGLSQRTDLSPGLTECYHQTNCKLKYVKSVSCVTQLSSVNPVTNIMNVAVNLPVGARLQNYWQTWLDLGAGPKVVQILKDGVLPPLSDPAKTSKISHCHEPLCKSPQEQLPVGGIASAYRQKCSRAGTKSKISGFLQPTIFSPKTKQQMETYTKSEQTQSFPPDREVQNGNTRNHQNFPPTRGVGDLNRFQGGLLPYTNTGTFQEISEISCRRSDIPVQSPTIWSVHSTHGVHCSSKRGETDGHTQGYKNPPVPRRLVGEGHIPPGLSPHTQDI